MVVGEGVVSEEIEVLIDEYGEFLFLIQIYLILLRYIFFGGFIDR